VDALHPNNNSESVNLGAQYAFTVPGTGTFFLRGGYKALFMDHSEHGITYGAGMLLNMLHNQHIKVDYSHKTLGILGDVQTYTISFAF